MLPTWPVSVAAAAYPALTASPRAGKGITPAHAPLPTDWSLPFHPPDGSHTSTLMSESRVGVRVAVTRQKAGRLPSEAGLGTVTGGPGGIVNGPGATGPADVMVVFASVKVSRLSHVAASDGRAAPIVAIIAIASESLVLDVIGSTLARPHSPMNYPN